MDTKYTLSYVVGKAYHLLDVILLGLEPKLLEGNCQPSLAGRS